MPNANVKGQLRLAVEARQCPLRSRAGKMEEEKDKLTLIKPNNAHLAGGGQYPTDAVSF